MNDQIPIEVRQDAFRRQLAKIEMARRDVNAYIEYTTKVPPNESEWDEDEEDDGIDRPDRYAEQNNIHMEWQAEWSRVRRSIVLAPVGTGKTTQIRKRLEWEMGRNHNILISYISAAENHPKKQLAAMQEEIERNPRVKHVFPTLRRATSRIDGREKWSAKEMLIARDMTGVSDPTVQIFGKFGKILGSRSNIIVLDDLINFENSLTEESRNKIFNWLSEAVSRLRPGARVWAIGHIWHEMDALQQFKARPGWHYKRWECFGIDEKRAKENVASEGQDLNEIEVDLQPYSMSRKELEQRIDSGELKSIAPTIFGIKDIFEKMDDLGPVFTQMMLFNRLPGNVTSRFEEAYFTRCLQLGRGLVNEQYPKGFLSSWDGGDGLVYCGVDLGHRKKAGADLTVMFTAALLPNGVHQILDVRSGLWKAGEIIENLEKIHYMFGAIFAVENNGAQELLLDMAEYITCLPVRPHATTGVNKHDFSHGVEAMADQLRQGKWMIPCDQDLVPCEEIGACIRGCKVYDPSGHTSDHLMAWWICKEAVRLSPAANTYRTEEIDYQTRW